MYCIEEYAFHISYSHYNCKLSGRLQTCLVAVAWSQLSCEQRTKLIIKNRISHQHVKFCWSSVPPHNTPLHALCLYLYMYLYVYIRQINVSTAYKCAGLHPYTLWLARIACLIAIKIRNCHAHTMRKTKNICRESQNRQRGGKRIQLEDTQQRRHNT